MKIIYMMYLLQIAFINCYKKLGYLTDYEPKTFEEYKGSIKYEIN